MVLALIKNPLVREYNLSSVKYIVCGAAPLSKEMEDEVKKLVKGVIMRQGFGVFYG